MCGNTFFSIADPLNILGKTVNPLLDVRGLLSPKKDDGKLELPKEEILPDPSAIKDKAKLEAQIRAARRSKTILTSGAGVIDASTTEKKTLLGG